MPIIDDDVITMCPIDLIEWYDKGIKGLDWVKDSLENQYLTITQPFHKIE